LKWGKKIVRMAVLGCTFIYVTRNINT